MRGLDMLAQTCAPQEPAETAARPQALTDEECKKIASMVLEQLQGAQQKSEDAPESVEDPQPEPQEGESEDGESNA